MATEVKLFTVKEESIGTFLSEYLHDFHIQNKCQAIVIDNLKSEMIFKNTAPMKPGDMVQFEFQDRLQGIRCPVNATIVYETKEYDDVSIKLIRTKTDFKEKKEQVFEHEITVPGHH